MKKKILEIADEQSEWGMREQSVYDPETDEELVYDPETDEELFLYAT